MTDSKKVIELLEKIGDKIIEEKEFLTELDKPIGDCDHGINMARGFIEVKKKLETMADSDLGTIFKTAGMTLVSTVGGSAGPLYGTAFMKMGMVLNGKKEMSFDEFIAAFEAAVEGVKQRGKSDKGEKTMLDAMIPALEAIRQTYGETKDAQSAWKAGTRAAEDGVEYTKTIIATKGRASYVGERSIGHQDPGATSFTFMMETVEEAL